MRTAALLLFVAMLTLDGTRSAARADVDAQQVREAIDRGVEYLRRNQKQDGHWPEYDANYGGLTALCTLALLNSGVPPEDEQIQRALSFLRTVEPTKTYSVALQTMVFAAASPERDRSNLRRNVKWLEDSQIRIGEGRGAWSYPGVTPDNSNTQFALLALHEAERVGVVASDQTWRLALKYWLDAQRPEGAWSYQFTDNLSTGSMTCAGIASVVIAAQRLNEPDAKLVNGRLECCARQEDNTAVEKALEWLGRNFSVQLNPGSAQGNLLYYLYALERVGRLTARRFIGDHDWYREGADLLVRRQDQLSGYWKGVGGLEGSMPQVATSFALLFLSKGRRPVLMAKLRHGPFDDWNNHRHDVANLTAYVETRWKRELSWQIIDPRSASPADLIEAPVLYFNGREAPQFAETEVRALREYVNLGGFIFAERCCEGDGFDQGFRKLMTQAFPEPEYELHLLPPDHPVWHAEEKVNPDFMPPLWGIDVGCRTSVIYCPKDLSCFWEVSRPGRDQQLDAKVRVAITNAQAIGINVLAYATNREVKYKLDPSIEGPAELPKPEALDRAMLHIAKLRHAGGWNAAPGALINLQRTLAQELGFRVDLDRHEMAITDPALFRYHLAFMHGRNDFRLSAAEREQLKTYLERGGMLVADAVCASEAFARALRRELGAIWPEHPLEPIPDDHPLFTTTYGGFDIRKVSRRDPRDAGPDAPLAMRVRSGVKPELEGLKLGQRYAVIFSPLDLSCALERHESLECRGYVREDAARIAINAVLYSLH